MTARRTIPNRQRGLSSGRSGSRAGTGSRSRPGSARRPRSPPTRRRPPRAARACRREAGAAVGREQQDRSEGDAEREHQPAGVVLGPPRRDDHAHRPEQDHDRDELDERQVDLVGGAGLAARQEGEQQDRRSPAPRATGSGQPASVPATQRPGSVRRCRSTGGRGRTIVGLAGRGDRAIDHRPTIATPTTRRGAPGAAGPRIARRQPRSRWTEMTSLSCSIRLMTRASWLTEATWSVAMTIGRVVLHHVDRRGQDVDLRLGHDLGDVRQEPRPVVASIRIAIG